MSAGAVVLKVLWSEGVKVVKRDDGSLSLVPAALATPDIRQLARDAKPEIVRAVAGLPSAGLCPICGGPNGDPNATQAHCTDCALIAAERLGYAHDISGLEANRAA